uniref:Ribosomal protein L29 n=1 Tax=Nitophyllum punctatum TaxID=158729 RepID=A0A4D6WZ72_9FLOR|nr:ribosomal protein L29 [Nitophyllum punctatum]
MKLKNNTDLQNINIENQITELKKKLILLKIKKSTKQKIQTHYIKLTKYKISQLLTLKELNKQ